MAIIIEKTDIENMYDVKGVIIYQNLNDDINYLYTYIGLMESLHGLECGKIYLDMYRSDFYLDDCYIVPAKILKKPKNKFEFSELNIISI